ncbi:MAG: hypothetical protein QHI48_01345 [Bacteroidota bacterium]|nr:hypothetical protein [Bacteroidota bacterium]
MNFLPSIRTASFTAVLWGIFLHGATLAQIGGEEQERRSLRVGDQLVLNYFVSDPQNFENHLVITDVEGSGAVVNVLVYDTSGTLLDEEAYFLPIFGKVNYDPSARLLGKIFQGTIRIISDGGNVAAQYWQFHRQEKERPFNTALPVADGEGAEALLCQHFVADPDVQARLILSNPESDSSVTVAVTFYLDRGKQLSRDKYRIPPNGAIVIDPFEANEGLKRTGLAYCAVLGRGKITGEYWQRVTREFYQVSLPLEGIPKRLREW